MYPERNKKTLVIGPREIGFLVVALAILAMAAFVFALGISRLGGRDAAAAELAAIPTDSVVVADAMALPPEQTQVSALIPTPVLAPTLAPTVAETIHTVQAGETLIGIAAQYNVSVQAILDANDLTMDTVLKEGQTLIVPLTPDDRGVWHEVQFGETLISIAESYNVEPEAVQKANGLSDMDSIYVGQRLYIPLPQAAEVPSPEVTAAETATPDDLLQDGPMMSDWPRSIHEGALDSNYPLTVEHARFTLHYQPGTYPEQHLEEAVQLVANALAHVEAKLNVQLEGTFDVYVAGTLYAAPDGHLRGRSRSLDRRAFFLFDGSGTREENAYLITHELTHLISWNTWGAPSSVMLSEGLATYTGQDVLEGGGFMPYDQLCLGAYAGGTLPSVSAIEKDFQMFLGHNRHRFNYFGSACFVGYLIDTYGLEAMSELYNTSAYYNLYGDSLAGLDAEWQASLAARQSELTIAPDLLVEYTEEWVKASNYVYKNYNGSVTMHRAYTAVDRARIALWQGDYDATRRWLDEVYAITGYIP
jgi:LysM repeat protein